MRWHLSHRYDPRARELADRHYNREKVGNPQFAPPGRLLALVTDPVDAVWLTVWPKYAQHAWRGAWMNTLFRNENRTNLSSELIREAVAATRFKWPDVPELGMVTFVDPDEVRHKRDPGRCYLRAGFRLVGRTKTRDYLVFQLLPADMPPPAPAIGQQVEMLA